MSDAPAATAIQPEATHLVGEVKHTCPLITCRFDPSGQFVYASAQDNTIQRWSVTTLKGVVLTGHESWPRALAFHPSGSTLYSGGCEGRVIFWPTSAEAPQPERTIEAHDGWVRSVAVSPDGKLLATGGNDNLVKLWNAVDGTLQNVLVGHANHVFSVVFHPSGGTLISGDLKGIVRQWDSETGEELRQFDATTLWKYDPSFMADMGGVRAADFNADGGLLACGGVTEVTNSFGGLYNPAVQLFDFATGQRGPFLVSKAKFNGAVTGVKFHRDALVIVSTSGADGGHLLFFRPDATTELFDLKLPDVARGLSLHPDGLHVATPHGDGALRIWQMTAKAK